METFGIVISIVGLIAGVFFYFVPIKSFKSFFNPVLLDDFVGLEKMRDLYKVAIIDDQIDSFPVDFIRSLGFHVDTFTSISFADSLLIAKYDVVFLDVKGVIKEDLEEGGAKFIKILKQARSHLPIIAVSSGKFQPQFNDYFKACDVVLNKPISELRIKEELDHLKSMYFDMNKLIIGLKECLRKLPVSHAEKKELEVSIVKYFMTESPKEVTMQNIHRLATVDSNEIIRIVNVVKDRIDND